MAKNYRSEAPTRLSESRTVASITLSSTVEHGRFLKSAHLLLVTAGLRRRVVVIGLRAMEAATRRGCKVVQAMAGKAREEAMAEELMEMLMGFLREFEVVFMLLLAHFLRKLLMVVVMRRRRIHSRVRL